MSELNERLRVLLPWVPKKAAKSDLAGYVIKLCGHRDCFRSEVEKEFRAGKIDVKERIKLLDDAGKRWRKAVVTATEGMSPCQ